MQNVVSVSHRGGLRLRIRFDDGVEGDLDFAQFLKFRGVLAPLRDPTYFAKAFVHPEAGTVSWPNGVDLDTLVLYARVTRRSIRSLLAEQDASEVPPELAGLDELAKRGLVRLGKSNKGVKYPKSPFRAPAGASKSILDELREDRV